MISGILLGRDDELPIVLLDDDAVGRSAARELKQELYKTQEAKVHNLADYVGMEGAEIEDLVPSEMLISAVDRNFKLDTPFDEIYVSGKPIVPQIEAWATQQGLILEKGWKVPISVIVKRRLLGSSFDQISPNISEKWIKLFSSFTN